MAALTVTYFYGRRTQQRRGRRWPTSCIWWWGAAMTCLVIALNSPLATYAHALFWAHMIVHLLLITVAPAFLVAAQPIRLLRSTTVGGARQRVYRSVTSRPFRMVTRPAVTVPVYAAVLVTTHLTGFQQAMAQHMWIHDAETIIYLVSGYLLLLPVLGSEFVGRHMPFALRAVTIVACMIPDAIVGVTLMMSPHVIAPAYSELRAGWGPDALADQTIAGAIMWVGGDGLMMILILVIARDWVASKETSLGRWLDGVREQATVGVGTSSLDTDDAALAAYNARLAALNSSPRQVHGSKEASDDHLEQQ